MRAVSLLVLLCCSLLEGQSVSENDTLSRENHIQAENPRTEPPSTTSTQQSCQPDLHSVLREMSAMLAELRVEQRHTTTAVNNMETRLRASESQTEELKKKSEEELKELKTSFDHKVENLKKENEAQSVNQSDMETRLRASESQTEELKKKVEIQSQINQEELKDLKTSFENQVENLKKENEERKVAFSASLLGGEAGYTGPYNTDITLVYKHIFTNIGNAYNPATGYFTAPVRGVYQFRFHVHGEGGRGVRVALHKNGHLEAGTYSSQPQGWVSSSNGVSLLLNVGDVVCLKLEADTRIWDSLFRHSTFSGQMLFSV